MLPVGNDRSAEVKVRDDEQVRRTALHRTIGEFVGTSSVFAPSPIGPFRMPRRALLYAPPGRHGPSRYVPWRTWALPSWSLVPASLQYQDRTGLRQPRGSTDGRRSQVRGLHEAQRAASWHHTEREGEDEQGARPTPRERRIQLHTGLWPAP